ncbi:MAG: glycosyltransferase [Armatimonadota bacterium]|jgi:glycosyltransferase involved in cell wall biosynthesis
MVARTATPLVFVLSRWGLGGMEHMTYEIAKRLDPARYRPVLCFLRSPNGEGEFGDYRGLLHGKWDVAVVSRLRALFRQERPGAVFALGSGDAAFWGRVAAKLSRLPTAWWIHSMRDNVGRMNRSLARWTDAVVALSPRHSAFVTEHFGIASCKMEVVQNGVDWAQYQSDDLREATRLELGLEPEMRVVGTVGGLRPVKGYEVLIRAAAQLLSQQPRVRLVMVGDGEQRQYLAELVRSEGIADRVLFLGARRDVPRLLSAFDVFVLSSHSEAFPVSALQAMAAGLPVVATDVGCLSEIVQPETTGLLVPPGRPEALSHALGRLVQDRHMSREMGQRGREVVRERFPIQKSVQQFQTLADRLRQ